MKTLVMFATIVLISSAAFATTTLVGSWRFEEGTGDTTTDHSGTGNTGYLYRDTGLTPPIWDNDTPPVYGGNHSLYFPGGATIVVLNNPTLDITGSLSIHAYVKTESFVGNRPLVAKWAASLQNSFLLTTGGNVGIIQFSLAAPGSGSSTDSLIYSPDPGKFNLNEWTHLAAIYDQSQQEMSIYINGEKKAMQSTWVESIRVSTDHVRIGQYEGNHYAGWIDEVKIYSGVVVPDFSEPVPEPAALPIIGIGLMIIRKKRRA